MTRPPVRRLHGDGGQVGGIEVLPFAFLVFVSATLLFTSVWAFVDAKFAVSAASREAVRAFVEADSAPEAAAIAQRRGRETLDAYGRSGERATVGDPELEAAFGRCVRVTITVSYEVPAITIPFLGGLGSATPVVSTHSALVDPFRSGLAGPATC